MISGCTYFSPKVKSIEDRLKEQGMTDFSIGMINSLKNCECSLDDSKQINCNCDSQNWQRKVVITCKNPPKDEFELLSVCKAYYSIK